MAERPLAWLIVHRRLARDYERDPAVSEVLMRWTAIKQMLRRGSPVADQLAPNADKPEPQPSKTPTERLWA